MGKQLGCVVGLDAAAVKNASGVGNFSIPRGDQPANVRMRGLCLLRARGLAGADRPDRLVRDQRTAQAGDAALIDYRQKLTVEYGFGLPGFALGKLFANAQHGVKPLCWAAANLAATRSSVSP